MNDGDIRRPHYLHTLCGMMCDTPLSDLSTAELIAMVEIMIPAHSRTLLQRVISGPPTPPGKVLTLITSNGGDAAPPGWRADLL